MARWVPPDRAPAYDNPQGRSVEAPFFVAGVDADLDPCPLRDGLRRSRSSTPPERRSIEHGAACGIPSARRHLRCSLFPSSADDRPGSHGEVSTWSGGTSEWGLRGV